MEAKRHFSNIRFGNYLVTAILILHTSIIFAQSNLSTEGLYHKDFILDIYEGNFIDIPFDRDELIFGAIFNSHITSYAKQCDSSLPYNKIELLRDECVTERVTKDGYGWEISRTCVEWVKVGTGLYASPKMNEAKLSLDRLQEGDAFRNIFGMIMNTDDPIASSMNLTGEVRAAQNDMEQLIQLNECDSKALLQFQENLRLFALNNQSIQFNANLKLETGNSTNAISSSNHDYTRLMEDLVRQQSTKWKMNRYVNGSISNLVNLDQDAQGLPSKIKASYSYEGFFGHSIGTVILTFKAQLPECLYFHDFPDACRTPDRQLIAEFIKGSYLNK